ncbi:helix-turn-helix domain-containing protein [Paenibacillus wynnii]|uniref:helix-turn-helix domain-containing protein n=1 Tax=Paenibacillus wynnii TaxID=268407 RepID=UPI0027D8DFAC|nr:AraC family transcriptional regulator [Paenibacillus wynnii]
MEFVTIGREVHSGYSLPLYFTEHESCIEDTRGYGRWSLVLIEKGSGIISCGNLQMPFTSPVILCVHENEYAELNVSSDISVKSVYFDPIVVNSKFNFENVHHPHADFSVTEEQDLYLLRPFLKRNLEFPHIFTIDTANAQHITKLLRQMNETLVAQSDINWPCRSRSLLLEVLILLSKLIDQEGTLAAEEDTGICDMVNNVLIYLHTNYPNKITLNELSRMFHINRTTLNHQFSQRTNLSVIDYLIKYRVQIAATLLRDTLLPISEIMERAGFHNTTHFWRIFKKHTALSPSSYRKQNCWMYASGE